MWYLWHWIRKMYGYDISKILCLASSLWSIIQHKPKFSSGPVSQMFRKYDFLSLCKSIFPQWSTTEPEFNEQFVFMTNIVDLPKQVEKIKLFHCFREIGTLKTTINVWFSESRNHCVAPRQNATKWLLRCKILKDKDKTFLLESCALNDNEFFYIILLIFRRANFFCIILLISQEGSFLDSVLKESDSAIGQIWYLQKIKIWNFRNSFLF